MTQIDPVSPWRRIFLLAVLGAQLAIPSLGAAPLPVSPRAVGEISASEPCGSFTWAADPALELVLEVRPADPEGSTEVSRSFWNRVDLPADTRAWTPSLEDCLPPGFYTWRLGERTYDGIVWSDSVPFEVDAGPSSAELARASEIARAALGRRDVGLAGSVGKWSPRHGRPSSASLPLLAPNARALLADAATGTGVVWGAHARIESGDPGSAAVVAEVTHPSAEVFGTFGVTSSPGGAGGRLEAAGTGDLVRGLSGGTEVFRVTADGTVHATAFSGWGIGLTDVPGLDCVTPCVESAEIEEKTIDTADLADGAVTSDRLKPDAVNSAQLTSSAVQTIDLADGAVSSPDLASGSVGASEIALATIESGHLASGSVTTAKIADGAVGPRLDLDGDLAVIYEVSWSCHDSGCSRPPCHNPLTFATTCQSKSCLTGIYESCDGTCNQIAPQVCPNTPRTILLR